MGLAISSVIGGIIFYLILELLADSATLFGYLVFIALGATLGGFLYDRVFKNIK
jgi:hypothetical protein